MHPTAYAEAPPRRASLADRTLAQQTHQLERSRKKLRDLHARFPDVMTKLWCSPDAVLRKPKG